MGLYNINCVSCKSPFLWFSGNVADQSCPSCKEKEKMIVTADICKHGSTNSSMCNFCNIDTRLDLLSYKVIQIEKMLQEVANAQRKD